MNSILKVVLIFIFLNNCSLNKNSKYWTNEKISEDVKENVIETFQEEETLNLEFNPNLKISFYSKAINKSFINDFDNNNGRINFDGNLKNISKYKFSKIDNFDQYEPEISFSNNDIIFFDNKGSILKFDENSNLLWKKNYYSKSEKKQNHILFFANDKKYLLVADNLAKYYAIDIITGDLIWSKDNNAPFNSQIKIYKDKFFIIDFENTLRAFSINDGKEIWNIKTQNSLVRTQKKLSMVIVNDKIYFNNSLGDISSVDINSGQLVWQTPTQSSLVLDDGFFIKTSDIIADKNALYFSNNKNSFFSLDISTGTLNWKQKINSKIRPTLIDNYILTVSSTGYLIIIEKTSGNIIRVTNIFENIKPKLRTKIEPTGFIVGTNNIYMTTNNGKLFVVNTNTGETRSIVKIDNSKILRPAVLNKNLFIITDNSIIKLN